MTQRAIAAALLAQGISEIEHPSHCEDALAAVDIARTLGATIEPAPVGYRVTGAPQATAPLQRSGDVLHCRESALCARLFSPMAAALRPVAEVTGSGTLLHRPMTDLITALAAFGVMATAAGNRYLPLRLSGTLQHGAVTIDAATGSQVVSGLLMALPLLPGDSELTVKKLASRPYVTMTLELLQTFGIAVENDRYEVFKIRGNQRYTPQTVMMEGDWSNSAFWIASAAISGDIRLKGLRAESAQADKAMIQVAQQAGAGVHWEGKDLAVRSGALQPFRFNASDCPDLFPPAVLLAAFCEGVSVIEGAERLIYKESNRAAALQETFGQLGVPVAIENNSLVVHGGNVHGGEVSSFHDHRIAMAAACAGLFTEDEVELDDKDCVKKSYPDFFFDLVALRSNRYEL
jgi:3-phosphoshikimate 1-carboxyvinyltransferase